MTALHYAIEKKHLPIIQILLDTHKITRVTCLSAFNYALERGEDDIAGMLSAMVENEASLFIAEALTLALNKGQQEIVEVLTSWQKRLRVIEEGNKPVIF
jgi:hypothetical protein